MSISKDQRDAIVRFRHPLDDDLIVVSARTKYNRRYRAIVAQDGDQILREWWPANKEAVSQAELFLDGYRLAKIVFSDTDEH